MAMIPEIMQSIPETSLSSPSQISTPESDGINNLNQEPSNRMTFSSEISDGVADPLLVERRGYYSTGNITARTDIMENTEENLLLDTANDWKGSVAEVEVTDLTTLYVVNGTYDDGIVGTNVNPSSTNPPSYYPFGWNATSNSTDGGQTQRAAYDAADYIVVENEGTKIGPSGKQYTHYAGTSIVWTQTIENIPQVDDFVLSFDYLYLRGVLGDQNFSGNCTLNAFVDGNRVYNVSLPTLPSRGIWYETGEIPITITDAPSSFEFMIGLVIDETLALNADEDYNGDSIAEGISNTVYITAYLDNVRFISSTSPSFESVDLQFNAGSDSAAITGGSGVGTASIENSTYWQSPQVPVSITSNKTVSFRYNSRLLSHRFTNSTYTTAIADEGVSFEVNHGSSVTIDAFSYLGSLAGYEENALLVYHPSDWENTTVFDPFLNDVSSQCTFFSDYFLIPESALAYLGWYEIAIESPNYVDSIDVQINDSGWVSGVIFRPTNLTLPEISIQTPLEIPSILDNVNITWYLPNGTTWYDESKSGGVDGVIQGTQRILDSSQAGAWQIEVFWTNGTEIAFDIASFNVYHTAQLIAEPEIIETDTGEIITGIVRYSDLDTGRYLTDDSATISGNWSLSTVFFTANPVKNWWEASFNTDDVGAGNFTIHVDASRPFYDSVSCDIFIISTNVTRLNSPNAPWSSTHWGSEIVLTFNFEVYDAGASTWGPVTNNSDVVVDFNWTAGYWHVAEDATPGIYLITVDTSSLPSDTYLLQATFSKAYHQSQDLYLTLIVSPVASSLIIFGDTSARVNISDDYSLKLRYADEAEDPISGASVIVDGVIPAIGLTHSTVDPVAGELGNYSVTLTPTSAGVYTVRFEATEQNSEPATTVFVLVVNDVATSLVVSGGNSFEIGLTDVLNTSFTYKTFDETGIENASISILYTGNPGGISWDLAQIGLGEYSVEFSATVSGTYVVTIAAFKQYYQSASASLFLVVNDITTNLTVLNGTAGIVGYGSDYRLVLSYTNGTGYGLSSANVSIESVTPETGLSWDSTVAGDPGFYSILLTPETSNTFTVLVKASLFNHQVQFATFTITATAIATSLTVLNTSTTISFDQNYTVFVLYQTEELVGIENADLSLQNPPTGISYTLFEELGSGYYKVTISPLEIGTFDLVFRAERAGYQSDAAGFALSASRIQTELRIASGLSSEAIQYLQTSELSLIYERTDFNSNVTEADISIQMAPSTGLNWSYHEASGAYHLVLTPNYIGRWTLTISASKLGYALGSVQFILDVEPVTIIAELLTLQTATEGRSFPIRISLTQEGTAIPVTGALVEYRMTASGAPVGNFEVMAENGTNGVYEAWFTFPLYQSNVEYSLEVRVSKDNFELNGGTFVRTFTKDIDMVLRFTPIISFSGFILAAFVFSLVGLRAYNTRKRRKNLEALQVKKRFDDVSNLLGIITLHKKTGLPVYSKMIKGGFEEAMVSAFITAITHFRSEFEMDEKHWEFNVIPISDIISAVPTKSLIVAFITLRPPSKFQEVGMEAFGRAVGAMFDESLAEQRASVVDPEQTKILDTLFYDLLDGYLIERFRTSKEAAFPKKMQCLVDTAQQLENGEGFKLEDLAKGMATCGIEESHAYKLVMDAIDEDLLEIADVEDADLHTPAVIHDVPKPPDDIDDDEDLLP